MTTVLPNGLIEFRFFRPDATHVCIAGTFNGWQGDFAPMRSIGDGWWRAVLRLPGGLHHFRYVADGQWYTDYASHGIERGKHGWNSILLVGEQSLAA